MGIIMTMYAERRLHDSWYFLGEMEENSMYEIDPEHRPQYVPEPLYSTENRSVCSILADVRNEGLLEEKYDSITSRRGLPDYLSPELKAFARASENQGTDIITSWLTLQELITFDWGKIRKQHAIVDERVTHLFHPERGFPWREWPQDIPITYGPTAQAYANVSWTETYADAAGRDFMELVDTLAKTYGITDDVRFVLWFR